MFDNRTTRIPPQGKPLTREAIFVGDQSGVESVACRVEQDWLFYDPARKQLLGQSGHENRLETEARRSFDQAHENTPVPLCGRWDRDGSRCGEEHREQVRLLRRCKCEARVCENRRHSKQVTLARPSLWSYHRNL